MLLGLAIRDIVLIDRLELTLSAGLCVLTGETGAGKSILLDALGLALGARGDSALVRHGAEQGVVTASFQLPAGHPAQALLQEQGLAPDGDLVVRRVISADGRSSRAFVNDQPVSIGLLRSLGALLVEVHGQNEEQGLTDASTHRGLLDAFGGHRAALAAVRDADARRRSLAAALSRAEADSRTARRDEDYLRHVLEELNGLDPKPGEEEALAAERALLMQGERIAQSLRDAAAAIEEGESVAARLRAAERALERVAEKAAGRLDSVLQALARAQAEVAESCSALDQASRALDLDPGRLEKAEERLFALRAAGRKHNCAPDDLPALRDDFARRLGLIDGGEETLRRLAAQHEAALAAYRQAAEALTAVRISAAKRLDKAVAKELPPLKLGAARFSTEIAALPEADWSAEGADRVTFKVATNPGTPPGPLAKIASGGEMSRFMLALKVVMARQGAAPTLVFDEVDRGVGGATADAVGERLARLAAALQVLVVTHSPQVAARGNHHWRVAKVPGRGSAAAPVVSVVALDADARQEEIARMLAGATVTEQARAAAGTLLQGFRR